MSYNNSNNSLEIEVEKKIKKIKEIVYDFGLIETPQWVRFNKQYSFFKESSKEISPQNFLNCVENYIELIKKYEKAMTEENKKRFINEFGACS